MDFDAFVLGLVAFAAGVGAWKGLAWQLGLVAAPAAGLAVAWPLSAGLAPHLCVSRCAAFAILYAMVTLLVYAAALGPSRRCGRAEPGLLSRLMGLALGAVAGAAMALVLTAVGLRYAPHLRDRLPSTRSGALMERAARAARPSLPPSASELLGPWLDVLSAGQRRNA